MSVQKQRNKWANKQTNKTVVFNVMVTDFFLFSVAILQYLAAKKGVADHWYPADPRKRARVNEYIMWHATGMIPKSNLFRIVVGSFCHESLSPACHLLWQ